jgi:hypothetical protein
MQSLPFLSFENPGHLDERVLFLMGANIKENDNPIGTFGTGLKYSVAIILRLGGRVIIQPGDGTSNEIIASGETIRGKEFVVPIYRERPLPITLEYGKTWQPWMAYRELRSNMMDEAGKAETYSSIPEPEEGLVRVIVRCDEIFDAHSHSGRYFFSPKESIKLNDFVTATRELPGQVFYRGILVHSIKEHCNWGFNITARLDLAEDRSLSSSHLGEMHYQISNAIEECDNLDIITDALTQGETNDFFSSCVLFVSEERLANPDESSPLYTRLREIFASRPDSLREYFYSKCLKAKKGNGIQSFDLLRSDKEMIEMALDHMHHYGMPVSPDVIVWKADLGENRLGLVRDNIIYIGKRAFDEGFRCILATLIEEYVHHSIGYGDFTRGFQDWTLRKIVEVISIAEDQRENAK